MNKLIMIIAMNFLFIGTSEGAFESMNESSTFSCKKGLVSINDTVHEVKEKCGEPSSWSNNQWYYDFGRYNFLYVIKFRDSKVYKIINTGNYGLK